MAISFRVVEDIVFMEFSGDVSQREALESRVEASTLQNREGVRGYLVDIRSATIHMSTIDLFNFFTSLQQAFVLGTKHAVLYSPQTNSLPDIAFGENVSVNRGVALRMFSQEDEAMSWLNGDAHPHKAL